MQARAPYDAPARPDASMSLLTNLIEHSLDEGYAEAAARRAAGHEPSSRNGWLFAAGLVLIGLLLATAALQVRNRAPAAAQARDALTTEIGQRTAATDQLETDVQKLRASVAAAREDALGLTSTGSALAATLSDLEVVTGAGAVRGPGLAVHLEDAKDAASDPRGADSRTEGRITDRDLQTIVNEVWAAGAEAIAINGQRLTSLSAIRSAGQAILVDFRPLSPPYDVVAVGDSNTMQRRVVDGFGGSYLQVLRNYGITYTVKTRTSVALPAAAGLPVRYATVPEQPAGNS
ncbi:MAG: DUF881 domain-containing protein [Sporichthyaceae bacterium]